MLLFDGDENRATLQQQMSNLNLELEKLCAENYRIIDPVSQKQYKFHLLLSSDMKFLVTLLGLCGPTDDHPCFLCDVIQAQLSSRSAFENDVLPREHVANPSSSAARSDFGVRAESILPPSIIDWSDVLGDVLHNGLRVYCTTWDEIFELTGATGKENTRAINLLVLQNSLIFSSRSL